MGKRELKSQLSKLDQKELISLLLELYSARKEAKEWLDYWLEPNDAEILNKYKAIIKNEFFPKNVLNAKNRFSVCNKAISDFKKLKPSNELIAELLVFYAENFCEFASEFGVDGEAYYISAENNFEKVLLFLRERNLEARFNARVQRCLQWAVRCGWGFHDTLEELYSSIIGFNFE